MKTKQIPVAWSLLLLGLTPLKGQKSIYTFPFDNEIRLLSMEMRSASWNIT